MIQEAQKVFPKGKFNIDSQGSITSIDFGGQHVTPDQWGKSVQADATVQAKNAEEQANSFLAGPEDPSRPYATLGGGGVVPSGGASVGVASTFREGTVGRGVGSDAGLLISNGDGSVSPL